MPAATYAGHSVAVNDEGFLVDPAQWTEDMAPQIAKSAGIEELTGAALADHQVHAGRIPGQGDRRHRPRPRQDLPRQHQGAMPAVPQGTGQDCREDRRDSQSATSTSRWPRSATRACTSRPWLAPCRDARADDQLPGTQDGEARHPPDPGVHRDDRRNRVGIYGCQASCDLFGLTKDDLIEQVKGHHRGGRVLCPRGRRPDHLHLTGPCARTGAWAVSQPPSLDLNTPGGILGYHRRNVRSTRVQPSCLRPLQEDHLDWLRPACGAGPHRGPA